jgi:hypothetical protein
MLPICQTLVKETSTIQCLKQIEKAKFIACQMMEQGVCKSFCGSLGTLGLVDFYK